MNLNLHGLMQRQEAKRAYIEPGVYWRVVYDQIDQVRVWSCGKVYCRINVGAGPLYRTSIRGLAPRLFKQKSAALSECVRLLKARRASLLDDIEHIDGVIQDTMKALAVELHKTVTKPRRSISKDAKP